MKNKDLKDLKEKIQHLFGEYKPDICMESENLRPGWRVCIYKFRNPMKNDFS